MCFKHVFLIYFLRKGDVKLVMILLNDDFNLEDNDFQNAPEEARKESFVLLNEDVIKLFLSNDKIKLTLKKLS